MPASSTSIALSQRARGLEPSATFAVSARVKALKAAGRDVVGLGAGEPDFDTPEPIKEAAIAALRRGMTGYQPIAGPADAREAIAAKLSRENSIRCTAADIVINVGAKHSIYLAFQALVDPGREVVLPTPAWVSYRPMAELCGGRVVEVAGPVERDFRITPDDLERAITPRSAVIVLNSPSNPCGTMYTERELRSLAEVIERHEHVAVVSDEIYEKLILGDVAHFSIGSIESIADRVVTVNGLSKAYAMTGWRLGYVCAPGKTADGALAEAISNLQSQMTSHATSFACAAIREALEHGGAAVESMRRTFAERGALMHRLLVAIPGIRCPKPMGAFYAFPDISAYLPSRSAEGRAIDSARTFAEGLLEEALVGVVPGEEFGACAKTHVRLSFACSKETIEKGCERIASWVGTLKRR